MVGCELLAGEFPLRSIVAGFHGRRVDSLYADGFMGAAGAFLGRLSGQIAAQGPDLLGPQSGRQLVGKAAADAAVIGKADAGQAGLAARFDQRLC